MELDNIMIIYMLHRLLNGKVSYIYTRTYTLQDTYYILYCIRIIIYNIVNKQYIIYTMYVCNGIPLYYVFYCTQYSFKY